MRKRWQGAPTQQHQSAKDYEVFVHPLRRIPAAVAILDAQDTVLSWNSWAEQLTGYTLEEVQSQRLLQLVTPTEMLQRHLQLAHANIPTLGEAVHLRKACGRQIRAVIQCSPIRHLNQNETHVIVVMQELPSPQDRGGSDREWSQEYGLSAVVSGILQRPLQVMAQETGIMNEALQQPLLSSAASFKQCLTTIKATIAELHRGLNQLRLHTDTLFNDLYNSINVLYLQADLLEEAIKRLTPEQHTELARSLTAIEAEVNHIHKLVQPEA